MPTSSIFTNIVINDPEKVEKFIDALEASSHDPAWQAASPIKQPLTDIEKIRELRFAAETANGSFDTKSSMEKWFSAAAIKGRQESSLNATAAITENTL